MFQKLNRAEIELDIQFLPFHEHSFAKATKHVGRWLEKHGKVVEAEMGLSMVWNYYKDTALNLATISSSEYVAWTVKAKCR